jgi:hypothetical protein
MKRHLTTREENAATGVRRVKQPTSAGKSMTVFCVVLCFGMALFSGCTDTDEANAKKGKEAAKDFCNCYRNKSKDVCLGELTSNYPKAVYTSSKFISAFNEVQTCGIELELIQYSTGK